MSGMVIVGKIMSVKKIKQIIKSYLMAENLNLLNLKLIVNIFHMQKFKLIYKMKQAELENTGYYIVLKKIK